MKKKVISGTRLNLVGKPFNYRAKKYDELEEGFFLIQKQINSAIPKCSKCGTKDFKISKVLPLYLEIKCTGCGSKKKYSDKSITQQDRYFFEDEPITLDLFIEMIENDFWDIRWLRLKGKETFSIDEYFLLSLCNRFNKSSKKHVLPLLNFTSNAIEDDKIEIEESSNERRRYITQEVMDAVWNRDGGSCVVCGSNENLEFDHIIPWSKGGANTYRNLQLLCEPCNRSKSDKIG